ncbi:MAG: Fe-S protein assembly co-chaperone HscB [Cytophagales bacterium]|nr:Fe-S protein assembly co-chaperone HscB [Rhizobacter sp.]
MKLDDDDFTLLGLPQRFAQDRPLIDTRWRELQTQVHPDRFAAEGAASQRIAMQWAVRVNEAYQRMRDPLKRAAYLCELNGAPINAENNTAMPPGFLAQQMEWREALDEATSLSDVEALADAVTTHRKHVLERLQHTLDAQADFLAAAQQVRALMFVERFADDVDQRLEALGQ